MTKAIVGIIGGSGIYDLPGLEDLREESVTTPWGEPSDALRFGRTGDRGRSAFPRHLREARRHDEAGEGSHRREAARERGLALPQIEKIHIHETTPNALDQISAGSTDKLIP